MERANVTDGKHNLFLYLWNSDVLDDGIRISMASAYFRNIGFILLFVTFIGVELVANNIGYIVDLCSTKSEWGYVRHHILPSRLFSLLFRALLWRRI